MINSVLNWLGFHADACPCTLEKNKYATSKTQVRYMRLNGQYAATCEIPRHLRDLVAFELWVYKKHKMKFKTELALINAFNKERNK